MHREGVRSPDQAPFRAFRCSSPRASRSRGYGLPISELSSVVALLKQASPLGRYSLGSGRPILTSSSQMLIDSATEQVLNGWMARFSVRGYRLSVSPPT
jgi:hypothetical protein